MKTQCVTLELLRRGPAHNQLLSPLTPYLAVCGNSEPEDLFVPYQQAEFLRKLKSLRYGSTEADLAADAREVQRTLVDMLAGLRCLRTALAEARDADLIVLELVLTASELALLPFELCFRPGTPTRELASADVVIFRRTRRVPSSRCKWPHAPRILFAFSDAGGTVPAREHVLALRTALAPFLVHTRHCTPEEAVVELKNLLAVLPNATPERIREAVQAHRPTHVHLLAHGIEKDGKFGLCLRSGGGSPTLFDGEQLSAMLSHPSTGDKPACVSIAACDGGNVGDVIYAGGSLAHQLQEGGVPFVVASQFPLSFRGSVSMTQELYESLLSARPPARAAHDVRASLLAGAAPGPGRVDWASVVTYGALPVDLDAQIAADRAEVLDAWTRSATGLIDDASTRRDGKLIIAEKSSTRGRLLEAYEALQRALESHQRLIDPSSRAWTVASVWKRWAEAVFRALQLDGEHTRTDLPAHENWRAGLHRARSSYVEEFNRSGNPSAFVQKLACQAFVGERVEPEDWYGALAMVRLRQSADWSLQRCILELEILAPVVFEGDATAAQAKLTEVADPTKLHLELTRGDVVAYDAVSFRRQLDRYKLWVSKASSAVPSPVLEGLPEGGRTRGGPPPMGSAPPPALRNRVDELIDLVPQRSWPVLTRY